MALTEINFFHLPSEERFQQFQLQQKERGFGIYRGLTLEQGLTVASLALVKGLHEGYQTYVANKPPKGLVSLGNALDSMILVTSINSSVSGFSKTLEDLCRHQAEVDGDRNGANKLILKIPLRNNILGNNDDFYHPKLGTYGTLDDLYLAWLIAVEAGIEVGAIQGRDIEAARSETLFRSEEEGFVFYNADAPFAFGIALSRLQYDLSTEEILTSKPENPAVWISLVHNFSSH